MIVFPLGNTNFKTKLTIFVSKFVRGNRAESQNCKNSPTQLALKDTEAMREQFRCCCFTTFLWTTVKNEHKQNNKQRSHFLEKIYLKTQMFCIPMKFALQFQRNVSLTQLKFFNRCDENYTTIIRACFLKKLLDFNISSTKKSITQR